MDSETFAAWLQSPEVVRLMASWFMKATGTPGPDTEIKYRRTAERALAALAEQVPSK